MKSLLENVGEGQLGLVTPCVNWDVRALVKHIVSLPALLGVIGQGKVLADNPAPFDEVDGDWANAYAKAADFEWLTWSDDKVLDRQVSFPTGPMSGRDAARSWVYETLTHAWDLATATEQGIEPPVAVVERALASARECVPNAPIGKRGPFGPVVEVGSDASPLRQLAAWLGR
jgi:uncharacterized protein (TIGR03086 family)